jgi:Holliday junction resolvase-like predicted endonuclease
MSVADTAEHISHVFFSFGLVYATLFCFSQTIIGISRWLLGKRSASDQSFRPRVDSAEAFGDRAEREVEDQLRNLGIPTLRNVFLRGAKDRLTEIDLLALVGSTILAIEVKAWPGQIIGALDDKEWIQVKGRGTRKVMGNPLEQNRHHLRVLRAALPGAACDGLVVFTAGTFADGLPSGVLDVSSFLAHIDQKRQPEPDDATQLGWGKLSNWSMRQDKAELQQALIAQIQSRQAEGLLC